MFSKRLPLRWAFGEAGQRLLDTLPDRATPILGSDDIQAFLGVIHHAQGDPFYENPYVMSDFIDAANRVLDKHRLLVSNGYHHGRLMLDYDSLGRARILLDHSGPEIDRFFSAHPHQLVDASARYTDDHYDQDSEAPVTPLRMEDHGPSV